VHHQAKIAIFFSFSKILHLIAKQHWAVRRVKQECCHQTFFMIAVEIEPASAACY